MKSDETPGTSSSAKEGCPGLEQAATTCYSLGDERLIVSLSYVPVQLEVIHSIHISFSRIIAAIPSARRTCDRCMERVACRPHQL